MEGCPGYSVTSSLNVSPDASICAGEHETTKVPVTIRVIKKSHFAKPEDFLSFRREIEAIRNFDHPFIAPVFDVIETDESLSVVMESDEGPITRILTSDGMSEGRARHLFTELLSAILYIHEQNSVYKALSLKSIHLDNHNNIRLVDLGFSGCFEWNTLDPAEEWTRESDVFALGQILLALSSGDTSPDAPIPDSLSESLVSLIQGMLDPDPDARIKLEAIPEHPWVVGHPIADLVLNQLRTLAKFKLNVTTSSGLDFCVLQKMTSLGFQRQSLVNGILQGDDEKAMTSYRLLRRQKITEEMRMFERGSLPTMGMSRSGPLLRNRKTPEPRPPRLSTVGVADEAANSPVRQYRNNGAMYFKRGLGGSPMGPGSPKLVSRNVLTRAQLTTLSSTAKRVCPL